MTAVYVVIDVLIGAGGLAWLRAARKQFTKPTK